MNAITHATDSAAVRSMLRAMTACELVIGIAEMTPPEFVVIASREHHGTLLGVIKTIPPIIVGVHLQPVGPL
jgi:hypothetical protein